MTPKAEADPTPAQSASPTRYSASVACDCGASVPITANEGAHSVECFACGATCHLFLGDPSRQIKPTNLKEEI